MIEILSCCELLFDIMCAAFLCMLIHEGSHYGMALLFGKSLSYHLEFGRLFGIPIIPRGIWTMPGGLTKTQQKFIAYSGFTGEFLIGVPLCWHLVSMRFAILYLIVAFIHLGAYDVYAGDASDFQIFDE